MPRVNIKKSTKFYDEMSLNGWNLKFEYETENDVLSGKIIATGAKANTSVFVSKENSQVQTIFSNGDYDAEVVTAVIAEFTSIVVERTPAPAEA